MIVRPPFVMSWTERNGPPVSPPERRGFGTTVVDSIVKQTVNGEVQLDYAPSGLVWRLTCLATNAMERERNRQNNNGSARFQSYDNRKLQDGRRVTLST